MQLPPLSLYIHVPWCIKKCPYCDFNSHTFHGEIPETAYIEALIKDLQHDLELIQNRVISSIFIGGGTPSLLSAKAYSKLISYIRNNLDLEPNLEITMEVNPGATEHGQLSEYISAGINRISFGVQSFVDKHLKKLGRIHSAKEAIDVIKKLKQDGFNNINIDLMYGLPEQKHDQALNDLQTAIDLEPAHISWYELTIEPNTIFYSKPPTLPPEDEIINIQQSGYNLLKNNGFNRYEISAYSLAAKESKHNINYWLFGDYIGIGAGAHGKITYNNSKKIIRYWKTRMPNNYLQALAKNSIKTARAGTRTLDNQDITIEFFMNALRIISGVDKQVIYQRTQINYNKLVEICANSVKKKLLYPVTNDKLPVRATKKGLLFLNELLANFA